MTLAIAHLSDIHFGGENAPAIRAVSDWLTVRSPDLIIITGDITAFGAPAEFRRAAAWAQTLTAPFLITPGNHDTPYAGMVERLFDPFGRYRASFGPSQGARISRDDLEVAAVNTARGMQWRWNWSKGAITSSQAEEALEALSSRQAGALGLVACHHPLVEMIGGPMTGRVRGGEVAAKRFCEGGVDLILTGHIHAPFAMAYPYSDGRSYAVGASTLSVRERGAPAGFNLIEADRDLITVTAHAWTGSAFEVWRTWSLNRRQTLTIRPVE